MDDNVLLIISGLNNIYAYDGNYSTAGSINDKTRIALLPYVEDFLQIMTLLPIRIKLLIRSCDDKEILQHEYDTLHLSKYFPFSYILYDELHKIEGTKVIFISEIAGELIKLIHKDNLFLIFNFLLFNDTAEYLKLQEDNISLLKPLNKVHLVIETLRQANDFITFISENKDKSKKELLENFFNGSVHVVYAFDSKSSAKNYRKRELATSLRGKVKYTPFVNKAFGLDQELSSYDNFDIFLQRCPYFYLTNKELCTKIQNIMDYNGKLSIHSMDVIEKLFFRYNVYDLIKKFTQTISQKIEEKYSISLSVPYSFYMEVKDNKTPSEIISAIKDELSKYSGEISYPFIIKPNSCTLHDMFLILNESGLDNLFHNTENLAKFIKFDHIIIQQFISHGGSMFKNYFLNNQSFTIVRPSLPDMDCDTIKPSRLDEGNFNFTNEFLYQKEDPNFFLTSHELELKNKVNYSALDEISSLFVQVTGISLFGLDYLFDINRNIYYILEVNYFPSYRELGTNLIKEFAEHLSKFKKNQ